jgi:hypothetical protein
VKRTALIGAAVAMLGAVFALKAAQRMPDFEVYWRGGERARHAEPLYRIEDGHYQFKYLPAFAVLAVPIAVLPLPVAKAIWFTLSVFALAFFVALSVALLPDRRKRIWVLVTCTVIAMAKFYGHELVLGQVNIWLGAIFTSGVLLLRNGRDIPAALLFALAVVVKPYAAIFLPWLAAIRCWRPLLAGVAGIVASVLLPVPLYGVSGTIALHAEWWRTVSESTAPNLLNADNVSLAGMYAKWLEPGALASMLTLVTTIGLTAFVGHALLRRHDVRSPLMLEAALLLTLMPLLSPQGWDYVFLLATPAIAVLVNYDDRLPVGWRVAASVAVAIAAFSLFDIMGRRAYAAFMATSMLTVCFLVVIGALHALRAQRVL